MKTLSSKKAKIIYIALVIVMVVDLLVPIYSYADADEVGGRLFNPIAHILLAVSDLIYDRLQDWILGVPAINENVDDDQIYFVVILGPSTIFSNKVPSLNANFIHPLDDKEMKYTKTVGATYNVVDSTFDMVYAEVAGQQSASNGTQNIVASKNSVKREKTTSRAKSKYYDANKAAIEEIFGEINNYEWPGALMDKYEDFMEDNYAASYYERSITLDNTQYTITLDEFGNEIKMTLINKSINRLVNTVSTYSKADTFTQFKKLLENKFLSEENPGTPSNPTDPSDPSTPSNPTDPSDPSTPSNPTDPSDPSTPSNPGSSDSSNKESLKIEYEKLIKEKGNELEQKVKDNHGIGIYYVDFEFHGAKLQLMYNGEKIADRYTLSMNGALTIYSAYEVSYEPKREVEETSTIKSVAKDLQPIISKWYKALRLISLVSLLSSLVYVGIRILISVTGKEKAKYQKMLIDWFAAVVILFVLHYIMALTITITEELIKIFPNTTDINGTDLVVKKIRDGVIAGAKFTEIFPQIVIYMALVILTCVFIVHYLKRFVYLAFLTMIAPLIALTYPLDKIKDGQAQAFSLWLREYVFNSLIPVIHLLIYTMFTGLTLDLLDTNPLYALICFGFMIPAEKFIRKMFGFDKASSVGQLGAAAGGAMAMNMINNLKKTGQGGGNNAEQGEDTSSIRTSGTGYIPAPGSQGRNNNNQPLEENNPQPQQPRQPVQPQQPEPSNSPQPEQPQQPENPTPQRPAPVQPQPSQPQPLQPNPNDDNDEPNPNTTFGETIADGNTEPPYSRRAGVSALRRKYISKPVIKRGVTKGLKWTGKRIRKTIVGGIGAVALGTVGLAAGVASGDLGKAAKYTGAAALIGYKKANDIGDKLTKVEKNVRETYKENKWGTDEYETRKAIKELEDDQEFMKTLNTIGLNKRESRELIRQYFANGIVDKNKITNALNTQQRINRMTSQQRSQAGFGAGKITKEEMIAAQKLSQGLPKSYWGSQENRAKFRTYLIEQKHLSIPDAERAMALISSLKGDLS